MHGLGLQLCLLITAQVLLCLDNMILKKYFLSPWTLSLQTATVDKELLMQLAIDVLYMGHWALTIEDG